MINFQTKAIGMELVNINGVEVSQYFKVNFLDLVDEEKIALAIIRELRMSGYIYFGAYSDGIVVARPQGNSQDNVIFNKLMSKILIKYLSHEKGLVL